MKKNKTIKIKILLFLAVIFCLFFSCKFNGIDTIIGTIGDGKLYFKRGNSARNSHSITSITGNKVEFDVREFALLCDTDGTKNARVIGEWIDIGGKYRNNAGWYDIEGLRTAPMKDSVQGEPHSVIMLKISAIRVNGEILLDHPYFKILAGDITKSIIGFDLSDDPKIIPFQGIYGVYKLKEFIINVDETKLFKDAGGANIELADEWWNCFSFTVD